MYQRRFCDLMTKTSLGISLHDGLFTLRQFAEKKLEKQGSMCMGFVDLEKAFDTVSRDR